MLVSGLQLLLLGGSLSWLSFSLGRRSGLSVSEAMRQSSTIQGLSEQLSQRMQAPLTINALNQLELRGGRLPIGDPERLVRVFWRQMQVFPVAYINFGAADGTFVGMERTDRGELLLNEDTARLGRGRMAVHSLSADGERGRLLELIPGMTELHEEPWYVDTARAEHATWSRIYAWEDKPEIISIAHNAPLYDANRRLVGVIGVDMVLSQLSTWLASIWRDQDGLALIVEPDGQLVASSRPAETLRRRAGHVERNHLRHLQHPLAQALVQAKFERGDGREALRIRPGVLASLSPRHVQVGDRSYLLDASPWGKQEGLNWILLTAIAVDPEAHASGRNAAIALLASALALVLAVLLANRMIHGLLHPLRQLESEAGRLGRSLQAGVQQPLAFRSAMPDEASAELQALDTAIQHLVEQFNRLNDELEAARQREREQDARAVAQLRDKLHSSLQAAAVAHEINQPLSVLLLNSQLLLAEMDADAPRGATAERRQPLQTIADQAERVVRTIEKMRTLLRNVQTVHRRLDLREVVRSAVLYARSNGLDAAIALEERDLDRAAGPLWIDGDAEQIQIALCNLLRNAAEALKESPGPRPWIRISLLPLDGEVELRVEDNGPGFPRGQVPDEALASSKAAGSGLGLFVVRTTMANHGGRLTLAPGPGSGVRAGLIFPAQAAAAAATARPPAAGLPGPAQLPPGGEEPLCSADGALPTTGDPRSGD